MRSLSISLCTFLLCMGICFSCRNNEKDKIARLVTEWQGKEVLLPENSIFTIQGKDTVQVETNAVHKILVYVDSTGCTSCRLQLHKWEEMITEFDSIFKGSVQFLFYLTPKSVKDARYITRRDNFFHPVCLDLNNEIGQMNQFPKEEIFHTFLLDADNRVKVIGNPIHNKAVRSLYIDAITE